VYSPPFLSYKDLHITKHADQLIKILQDKKILVHKVIEVLEEQLMVEQEVKLKALVKEKAKEKHKLTILRLTYLCLLMTLTIQEWM
jgi:hypothetical protein